MGPPISGGTDDPPGAAGGVPPPVGGGATVPEEPPPPAAGGTPVVPDESADLLPPVVNFARFGAIGDPPGGIGGLSPPDDPDESPGLSSAAARLTIMRLAATGPTIFHCCLSRCHSKLLGGQYRAIPA